MSWAIWITGRPGSGKTTLAVRVAAAPDIALDYEESLHPELRLHTHAPDFRSTVEDVLLLARRLHRAAAAPVTPAGRNVS
jgi:adenylylsulfate kinase-like enzyme